MFKSFFAVLFFLFSTKAFCDIEDWYFTLSAGFANNNNPSDVEQVISSAENSSGKSRLSISTELGVYWPVFSDSVMLGLVSSNSSDHVSDSNNVGLVTHRVSHITISAIKYIDSPIGKGFFLRGDLGSANSEYVLFNDTFTVDNGSGSSVLVGAGYSKEISNESRLIFSFNIVNSMIEGQEHSTSQIMVGGLW